MEVWCCVGVVWLWCVKCTPWLFKGQYFTAHCRVHTTTILTQQEQPAMLAVAGIAPARLADGINRHCTAACGGRRLQPKAVPHSKRCEPQPPAVAAFVESRVEWLERENEMRVCLTVVCPCQRMGNWWRGSNLHRDTSSCRGSAGESA
jgi:hypothetical protein